MTGINILLIFLGLTNIFQLCQSFRCNQKASIHTVKFPKHIRAKRAECSGLNKIKRKEKAQDPAV